MKRLLSFVILMAALSCAVFASSEVRAEEAEMNSANIYFPETVFDFGSAWEGENVVHKFEFQNSGNETLRIDKVGASCGCSKAETSVKEVQPGESGYIEVGFNTAGYRGKQVKWVYVSSNDPKNPTTQLKLMGNVKIEVEIKPRVIFLGEVSKHSPKTERFEIIQRGEEELVIDKIKTASDYLAIDSVGKKGVAKKAYSIEFTLQKGAPAGNFNSRIEVYTNLERKSRILIPVQAKIIGDIQLSPERLMFRMPAETERTVSVTLSTTGDNFKVLRVEEEIEALTVKVFTIEELRKYRIDFTVNPKASSTFIRGKVKVHTNCPGEKEITIPVMVRIMKETIEVGYFFEHGCLGCERVHKILQRLQRTNPSILLKEYDVGSIENMRLNETLCERYNVPEEQRLVTPAVFIGEDFLIGGSIPEEKIKDLIDKYQEGAVLPLGAETQKGECVEERIAERFRSFGIFAIMGAGLLDGVNPCAFTTIIFLISYLALIKRKGKELIIVGVAFTSAVFITYLLIGVGLFEFLHYMTFLKTFAKILYGVIAVLAFVLGVLSLGDYFKCKRGEVKEMDLQLPNFLKKRIKTTIKEHARVHRYVLAAFVTGFVVSVLELSCTGQVYLPTVVYATSISELKAEAYGYLILYNFVFIVPLIVVFIMAYFGTTSTSLSNFFSRNIALIKLLTSILFFIFTAFLVMILIL
jgi:cytochrome c biogenesis protein CcdA